MARNSLNFKKNNAELNAADAAIAPFLAGAKISTVAVEGKDVAVADAPLSARIDALGKLIATGDKTEDSAELVKANGELAAQVEVAEGKLTVANATISAQTQKIAALESGSNTSSASVTKLTTDLGAANTLLEASTKEVTRLLTISSAESAELSSDCLDAKCLDLRGADGKPLAEDATREQKIEAAGKIPMKDRRLAFKGAVNSTLAKMNLPLLGAPLAGTGTAPQKQLNATEQCLAAVAAEKAGQPIPAYQSLIKK
jgi:hypothetical protein